jgi:starvation-inducible outer membrane lipoprotein
MKEDSVLKLNNATKRIAAMSALLLAGCTTAAQETTKQTAENQETIRQLVRLVEQAHKDSLRTDTGFYWFLCIHECGTHS